MATPNQGCPSPSLSITPSWSFDNLQSETTQPTISQFSPSKAKMFDATRVQSNQSRESGFVQSHDEGSDSELIPTQAEYKAIEKRRLAAEHNNIVSPAITSTVHTSGDALSSVSLTASATAATTSIEVQSNIVRSSLSGSISSTAPSNNASVPLPLPVTTFNEAPTTASSSLPLLAPVGKPLFNAGNPGARIHSNFKPSAVHTAKCDSCGLKNKRKVKDKDPKNVIQRCQDCNLQICHNCVQKKKIPANHRCVYEELDWNGGEGLHPPPQPKGAARPRKRKHEAESQSPVGIRRSGRRSEPTTSSTPQENRDRPITRALTSVIRQPSGRVAERLNSTAEPRHYMGGQGYNDDGSGYPGSATEEDPMDDEDVRRKFARPHPYRAGSMYGPSVNAGMGYGPPGPMGEGRFSDSSMGSGGYEMQHRGMGYGPSGLMHQDPRYAPSAFSYSNPAFNTQGLGMSYLPGHMVRPSVYPPSPMGISYASGHGLRRLSEHQQSLGVRPTPSPAMSYQMESGSRRPPSNQSRSVRRVHYEEPATCRENPNPNPNPTAIDQNPFDPLPTISSANAANAGMSRPISNDAGSPGAESIRFREFGEHVAEFEVSQKSAKEMSKEKASRDSKVAAFRYEMEAAWGHDETLLHLQNTNMPDAIERFQGIVSLMGIERGISRTDMAHYFKRVTGKAMRI